MNLLFAGSKVISQNRRSRKTHRAGRDGGCNIHPLPKWDDEWHLFPIDNL